MFDETNGLVLYNNQFQSISNLIPVSYISGFIFSSDGTRFYAVGDFGVPLIETFDGSTGGLISTAPAIGTIPPGEQLSPSPSEETPMAVDSTGIIFGSADHGIAFDDSTYSVNYILGFNASPAFDQVVTPDFAAVSSAVPVSFPGGEVFSFVPDVWFGNLRGTEATLNDVGVLTVNAPASSQPGPVNVKVIEPDGTPIFDPLAFSYGPTLLFVNGDTSSPAGGATCHLIGLGLPTDSTQIQVTVGNKSAAIVSATEMRVESAFAPFGYPYPAVDVQITLPPGAGDQSVQITTASGSATLSNAIHYVTSVTDYASSDSFQAIVLDRTRNQLYLSAGNHIDVFSLTTQQFLAPILPPALNGQKAFHGLAMTPDGAELLAANFTDGSVAIINLNQPASAQAVQVIPPGTFGTPGSENVVTTNTGKAFIESLTTQEEGCGGTLYELDLSTLQVSTITNIPPFCIQPEGFPIAASADGSKVLMATTDISGDQGVAIYDAATNSWSTNNQVLENFGGNAAISATDTVFATGSGMVDANANLLGLLSYWEVFDFQLGFAFPLERVSDGGSLVYIPYQNNVDIFDVNHGVMLNRLALVEQVQHVTNATALDQYAKNLYLITNAGLTAVQFASAPLAIGSISPSSGPSGTSITILGSGFRPGMTGTANGAPMAITFVNANTLQSVVPSTSVGAVQITVSDSAGHSYSLDDAFSVE
jgi:IPT/TIG domain